MQMEIQSVKNYCRPSIGRNECGQGAAASSVEPSCTSAPHLNTHIGVPLGMCSVGIYSTTPGGVVVVVVVFRVYFKVGV